MQHLDEGTIHAWLDGALSAEEASRAEAHVAACGSCAAAVAEARGFIAASSRILSALDVVPGDVLPAPRPRATWLRDSRLRIAASLLFVVGVAAVLGREAQRDGFSVRDEAASATEEPVAQTATAESDMSSAGPESTRIVRRADGPTSAPEAVAGNAVRAAGPRTAAAERERQESARDVEGAIAGAGAQALAATVAPSPAPPSAPPTVERSALAAPREDRRVEQRAEAKSALTPRREMARAEAAPADATPDSAVHDAVTVTAEAVAGRLLDSASDAARRRDFRAPARVAAPAPGARAMVGAAAGAAADEAPSARPTVEALAGCYTLSQGRWRPGVPDEEAAIIELPSRVRLQSVMGIGEPERGRYLLRAVGAGAALEGGRFGWWEPTSATTVVLGWGIGDRGVIARLVRSGDELRGQARTFRGGAETEWVREIVARRASCEVSR